MKSIPILMLLLLTAACNRPSPTQESASTNPPAPRMILPPITNPTPSQPSLINDLTGKTAVDAGRRAAQSARDSAAKENARNAEVMEDTP
jgi:hypothetical protein